MAGAGVGTNMKMDWRNWAHLAALALVGCLFTMKYVPRLSLNPVLITLGYLGFFVIEIGALGWLAGRMRKASHPEVMLFLGLIIYVAVALSAYLRMDPLNLRVDRWSCLVHFWDFLLHGRYPYQAMSHLDHPLSGFPAWFLVALPFYALGDVGLMQFAALFAFVALLLVKFRETGIVVFLAGILVGLPVFEYEVFTRSDLFANMVIAAWLMHLGLPPDRSSGRRLLLWGVAWGLMLSTRGIVIIPLIFTAFHILRDRDWKACLAFGAALSGTFIATFLPFYLWNSRLFWSHNPFDVQSGYIPGWGLALVILICCLLGYRNRKNPRLVLYSGGFIYATILGCLIIKSVNIGWAQAIWGSGFDISYFSLSVPFLLLSLGESLSPNLNGDAGNVR